MIRCDKCGFGHRTIEEANACKSWEQMEAERKEKEAQPAAPATLPDKEKET